VLDTLTEKSLHPGSNKPRNQNIIFNLLQVKKRKKHSKITAGLKKTGIGECSEKAVIKKG
jgi:hypothetical protein